MKFEYNQQKSENNAGKHGIDFVDAQALWTDPSLLILPSRFPDEPRFLAIGKIGKQYWTAVFTERSMVTRLISVRRARKEEKALYERYNQQKP